MPENTNKRVPKGAVKYNITLSEEQKLAKAEIRNHPFNFILGKAGSGKTLLAVQIALDCFFKREVNKIVITPQKWLKKDPQPIGLKIPEWISF